MKKITKWLAVFSTVVFLSGCSRMAVIQEVHSVIPSQQTVNDVRQAIVTASSKRGWSVKSEETGKIFSRLNNRAHMVEVVIVYDERGYKIHYLDSVNMRARNGRIHPKYVQWVRTLDGDIKKNLILQSH